MPNNSTPDFRPEENKRNNIRGPAVAMVAAATLIAAPFVAQKEGHRNYTYADVAGILTSCVGHTGADVGRLGTWHSDAQCNETLAKDLKKHADGIAPCITAPISALTFKAYISLAFNIGVRAACGSSAVRKYNAHQDTAACDAFLLWNRAGGRVVAGLTKRREDERRDCLAGLQ